jgi:hypothetical protein
MVLWFSRLVLTITMLSVSATPLAAASISQSYKSSEALTEGTMVSLDSKDTSRVVATTIENAANFIGTVIARENSTIALGDTGTSVQVVSTGTADVFVTDLNGAVKAGDKLTPSPVAGVAMRATTVSRIIGTAKGNMSATVTRQITDKSNKQHTIKIGRVSTILGISTFDPATSRGKSLVPVAIQSLANDIAGGREVAGWRIIVSIIILIIITILVFFLTYSSIRASIIAIGRNPLSAPAVYRSLFQLIAITLGLLCLALSTVYFLLRL